MILDPKQITAAYRCASCGQTVFGITGAMALTGDMIKLKCECGESALTIKSIEGQKARVSVKCVFCQTEHSFVISKSLLLSKDLFTYPCPYTGIDVCFFGTDDKVREAVDESDKVLSELLSEEEKDTLREMEAEEYESSDLHSRDMIRLVLDEIGNEGNIFCDCGTCRGYDFSDGEDYVEIKCKKCGAKRIFYCDSSIQTQDLLEADSVHLFSE